MKKLFLVAAGVIFIINGCGKSESVKQETALEREVLTVSEADMILAEAADPGVDAAQEAADISAAGEPLIDEPAAGLASSEAPDKKAIQEALKTLGLYKGAIDGKIGRRSEEAIREFQRSRDLVVDGKVGAKTLAALKAALAQKAAPAPGQGEL